MILTLVIPDPPPTRERRGRAAERGSPNSEALVSAGEALLEANPGVFPRVWTRTDVVFGKTKPEVVGYQPEDPIFEVLASLRVVFEPERWRSSTMQDPSADFYVVTLTLEDEHWQPPIHE